MEKHTLLAIVLSLLVLLSWSAFVAKTQRIDNKVVTVPQPPSVPPASPQPATTKPVLETAPSEFRLSQEKWEFVLVESWGAIKEVVFKEYQAYKFPLKYAFLWADKTLNFKKEDSSPDTLTFVYKDETKEIIKRFRFHNSNYTIELEVEVHNLSPATLRLDFPLVLGVLDFATNQTQVRYQDVTVATAEKIVHANAHKENTFPGLKFLGLRDRYFCAIIEPVSGHYVAGIKKINSRESEISLSSEEYVLMPGQKKEEKFRIYLGPQELRLIKQINPDWSAVIYYGTFDFISHLLLQLLEFIYSLVRNWGVAIIVLSLFIYLLLYPLSLKQMRSMKEMQALQPRVEEVRRTYKDNPQRLNKEIMELYRQHKVNPFGGCLPLILQIPVFFALYQTLMRAVALKGASFLWIKDLSEPDRLFTLPVSLPILGNEINLLPILTMIGMFIQQKTSLVLTTKESAQQQRLMMIMFPLLFGFIFYRMPSGFVLYWLINSTLMLFNQLRTQKAK